MVRSYYPSECHADYFDFERIEALKPAIEACGISTLSQSPMLGFHKQMDNRIRSEERRVGKECNARRTTNQTRKKAKMGKVMRHTLGASLNMRNNLSSDKGPKPLQLKLLTTYIPKTSAFTLAFSTSQRLRTTRASARTFFTFRHYITPSARNF